MIDVSPTVLLSLILAHLLGDFVFQTKKLCSLKKQPKWLLFHSLIQTGIAFIVLGDWTNWQLLLVIFGSHFLLDGIKICLGSEKQFVFYLDQAAHFLILFIIASVWKNVIPYWLSLNAILAWRVLVVLSSIILLCPVGGIVIGMLVKPFQLQIKNHYAWIGKAPAEGLRDGGRIIGWLERLLVFIFILSSQYAGIGFLIAAKSVFRFGELKDSENRKEAEYIIIGTFASFLYAIAVSFLVTLLFEYKP